MVRECFVVRLRPRRPRLILAALSTARLTCGRRLALIESEARKTAQRVEIVAIEAEAAAHWAHAACSGAAALEIAVNATAAQISLSRGDDELGLTGGVGDLTERLEVRLEEILKGFLAT